MVSPPNVKDIVILQGSRYIFVVSVSVEWLPTLVGYSARGQIRSSAVDITILATLDANLTVDTALGTVTLDLPASASTAWTWDNAKYSIEIFDGNAAHDVRIAQGNVRLDREVTR
jgi:hypothetical protein